MLITYVKSSSRQKYLAEDLYQRERESRFHSYYIYNNLLKQYLYLNHQDGPRPPQKTRRRSSAI